MPRTNDRPRWRLLTGDASGAIACVRITGNIDAFFKIARMRPVEPDHARLRDLLAVDRGVVARPALDQLLLFPHAGPASIERLLDTLCEHAIERDDNPSPHASETDDPIEARMLDTLACAQSPLAIDLLLKQPARWRHAGEHPVDEPTRRALRHLIQPALVVAIGPPNIGKSTLLNTLAGRSVALVADLPGTTRDHVGVHIDLDGLVVRYVDTPGISDHTDTPARDAMQLARTMLQQAHLVLECADARTGFTAEPVARAMQAAQAEQGGQGGEGGTPSIRVALRTDLRPTAGEDPGADVALAIPPDGPPVGIASLVSRIRRLLVPPEALEDPRPWPFWET